MRGGKQVALKSIVDNALDMVPEADRTVESVVVLERLGNGSSSLVPGRDHLYHELLEAASPVCPPEPMDAEDPLFILYTSGSTGKPKGVVHTSAGYLLGASMSHEQIFDYKPGEVFWCTADCGWITGHSYTVYGPLANGATTLMFEGVPTYPSPSRMWEIVDRHSVNCIYTAPTALRALMAEGDEHVHKTSRASLRVLGTVGEPINSTAWEWYHSVVGEGRCAIVDTWWQTETGAHMLTPMPGATATKPGSCCQPYFGVNPQLMCDETGAVLEGNPAEGSLVIDGSWPSQMRTIYGDAARFESAYYGDFPGKYFTGDRARRDEDG
jgi:acetyl-CoA synthetase